MTFIQPPSPSQEWRLHNGEGKVPQWFFRWTERVLEDGKRMEMVELKRKWDEITEYGKELSKFADKFDAIQQAELNILNKRFQALTPEEADKTATP